MKDDPHKYEGATQMRLKKVEAEASQALSLAKQHHACTFRFRWDVTVCRGAMERLSRTIAKKHPLILLGELMHWKGEIISMTWVT